MRMRFWVRQQCYQYYCGVSNESTLLRVGTDYLLCSLSWKLVLGTEYCRILRARQFFGVPMYLEFTVTVVVCVKPMASTLWRPCYVFPRNTGRWFTFCESG